MSAAGGTSVPLMLDWLMWLSMPKVNAECEKPETQNTIIFINNRVQIKKVHKQDTNNHRDNRQMPSQQKAQLF